MAHLPQAHADASAGVHLAVPVRTFLFLGELMSVTPVTSFEPVLPEGLRLRLDEADEGMHELGPESNFNESMYFNFYDPQQRLGGWVRLGNRANEGIAERTVCLYLPDGTVGFSYDRPPIKDNDSFTAGGLAFTFVEPFRRLDVSFAGDVLHLADGMAMADPKAAYLSNPTVSATLDLSYEGISPMLGGELESLDGSPLEDAHGGDFARGHYEQHVFGTGTVSVGDQTWTVAGAGLRDHSWGPRHWQSPWWYRWLTGNFGRHAGFVASLIVKQDGSRSMGGVVLRNGRYEQVVKVRVRTDWDEANGTQQQVGITMTTQEGLVYEVTGEVVGMVPLRNRRKTDDGSLLTTRIAEGMTIWTCPQLSDAPGSGLSEYLDQVIDGRPVGRDEEG